MLEQISKRSGEDATAIFAACRRYAGHLRDAAHIKASQLELLAALDTYGRTGQSINDTLQAYVAARKAAADKTHAAAMAALARTEVDSRDTPRQRQRQQRQGDGEALASAVFASLATFMKVATNANLG
ncbi:MAG: hypothetical protein V5B30_17185 [Candidatus Accumulibacter delftensis]|jgi:hypothetical protein